MKHLEVVCALIINNDKKIFICQRGKGQLAGKWEFPGGKVEPLESKEHAIVREIKEELTGTIEVIKYLGVASHEYIDLEKPFGITMYAYLARLIEGELLLTEHTDFKWVHYNEFDKYDFAEADIKLINEIKQELMEELK